MHKVTDRIQSTTKQTTTKINKTDSNPGNSENSAISGNVRARSLMRTLSIRQTYSQYLNQNKPRKYNKTPDEKHIIINKNNKSNKKKMKEKQFKKTCETDTTATDRCGSVEVTGDDNSVLSLCADVVVVSCYRMYSAVCLESFACEVSRHLLYGE